MKPNGSFFKNPQKQYNRGITSRKKWPWRSTHQIQNNTRWTEGKAIQKPAMEKMESYINGKIDFKIRNNMWCELNVKWHWRYFKNMIDEHVPTKYLSRNHQQSCFNAITKTLSAKRKSGSRKWEKKNSEKVKLKYLQKNVHPTSFQISLCKLS